MSEKIDIISNKDGLIGINKPHGLAVHRSKLVGNADEYAVQNLRDKLGKWVYPIHRIDRKTSGVLLFTDRKDLIPYFGKQFESRQVKKTYIAVVRGYTDAEGIIDYALPNGSGIMKEALTKYSTIDRTELPIPYGRYNTSRYSLLKIHPETGRMHQIRRHMAHIRHPIIGDRPYGCNKQNRLFLEKWEFKSMMLHARQIRILDSDRNEVCIQAPLSEETRRMGLKLGFTTLASL